MMLKTANFGPAFRISYARQPVKHLDRRPRSQPHSAHNRLGGMMRVVLHEPFGRWITCWAESSSSVGSVPPSRWRVPPLAHLPNLGWGIGRALWATEWFRHSSVVRDPVTLADRW